MLSKIDSLYFVARESTMTKVRRDLPYKGKPISSAVISLARGEYEGLQLVIVPVKMNLKSVRVEVSDLVGPGGATIEANGIEVYLVEYIEVKRPTRGGMGPGLYPDPLIPYAEPFDVRSPQPIWFSFYVPYGVEAGVYNGKVTFTPENAEPYVVKIKVRVYNFDLPKRPKLRTSFWLAPKYLRDYYAVKGWIFHVWTGMNAEGEDGYYGEGVFEWILDSDVYHSGKRSLCIDGQKIVRKGKEWPRAAFYSKVKSLEKGAKYRFSVWYKTSDLRSGGGNVKISVSPGFSADLPPSKEWKKYEKEFTAKESGDVYVYLANWAEGKVWFDDVELKRVLPNSSFKETVGEKMLPNSSFEETVSVEEVSDTYILNMLKHRVSPSNAYTPKIKIIENNVQIDWTNFDSKVALLMEKGLTGFNVPWVRREDNGELSEKLLNQTKQHLAQMGWLDLAYAYLIDEPSAKMFPEVKKCFSTIKKAAPGLKTLLTLGYAASSPWRQGGPGIPNYAKLRGFVDIWVPHIDCFDEEFLEEMRQAGNEIWIYVCVAARISHVNMWAIDYPGAAHRILFWQMWRYRVEGLLYWGINYWKYVVDPFKEAMTYPGALGGNGDGSLVYPGETEPINSIRWEITRDGIEDYDYLSILAELICEAESKEVSKDMLDHAKKVLDVSSLAFSWITSIKEPQKIEAYRDEVGKMIEELRAQCAACTT